MSNNKRIDQPTGTETVGHEWDGIEELNTPLPRWWLWTFYATIIFSIGYCIVFPFWPTANGAPGGTSGWSSRDELQKTLDARAEELQPVHTALATTAIGKLEAQPELMQQAIAGGAAAFKVHCVQCHGSGASGSVEAMYSRAWPRPPGLRAKSTPLASSRARLAASTACTRRFS